MRLSKKSFNSHKRSLNFSPLSFTKIAIIGCIIVVNEMLCYRIFKMDFKMDFIFLIVMFSLLKKQLQECLNNML